MCITPFWKVVCIRSCFLNHGFRGFHGLGKCVYRVLILPILPSVPSAESTLSVAEWARDKLLNFVRYILYQIGGLFSSKFPTKSPRVFIVLRGAYGVSRSFYSSPLKALSRMEGSRASSSVEVLACRTLSWSTFVFTRFISNCVLIGGKGN